MQTAQPFGMDAVDVCHTGKEKIEEQLGTNTTPDSISILDATAQEPWPQNVLMSILGWSSMQAQSFLESCPEAIGDIVYVLDHVSSTQREYGVIIKEFYRDNMPVSKLAVRHKTGASDIERILVEVISHMRDSHLPTILTSGLRAWKRRQCQFQTEKFSEQLTEPLSFLEDIGACELAWLRANGYSTVRDVLDGFRSDTGILYDGKYITEGTLRLVYDELEFAGVIKAARQWGRNVEYRVAPRPTTVKFAKTGTQAALSWPMNLWKAVVADEDAFPPEDLENTIEAAMSMLPPDRSKLLMYSFRDDLDAEAIGKRMGLKQSAVYMSKMRAIDMCQEPAVRRLLQYGLKEAMRAVEEFKKLSVNDMRRHSAVIVPLQSLQKRLRVQFAEQTIGEIVDYLELGVKISNRTPNKQNELCTLYKGLQRVGVQQAYWKEGLNINNPSQAPLENHGAPVDDLLEDLWAPAIMAQDMQMYVLVPDDIVVRLHFAMGEYLNADERQLLTETYHDLSSRNGDILDTELDMGNAPIPKETIDPILNKLRNASSLVPSFASDGGHKTQHEWPFNFLMRVFECESPDELRGHIPVLPPDIEEAIRYILESRFPPHTVKIIELYFKENLTCRAAGNVANVSGAYVGSTIKGVVDKLGFDLEAKRYFQLGYEAAKSEREILKETGANADILESPFAILNLPQRVVKAFTRAKINTVADVLPLLEGKEISGFGQCGRESTYSALDAIGIIELCNKMGRPIQNPSKKQYGHGRYKKVNAPRRRGNKNPPKN